MSEEALSMESTTKHAAGFEVACRPAASVAVVDVAAICVVVVDGSKKMEGESKIERKNAVMKDYGGGRIKRYGWEERVVVKCRGTREAATEW